ncbi:hypothetical protein AWB75_06822 [Caballeronia catudaia]|uniref:Uncharacterized protein n=1 Tax=Caballeronia catudaia TaxID=1777136 RepID=A0A158DJ16_9BURK|nr:hypothetical protein [Caballeronia catudaia]SAK94578.1 hypothetical protein AWB75_06822 [Caballeronia catudaia]
MPAKRKAAAGKYGSERELDGPVFSQPQPTPDPQTFVVRHGSDAAAYKRIDELNREHKLKALPFPAPRGGVEPRLSLAEVVNNDQRVLQQIANNGQLVFHATGDCGNTKGPAPQNEVADKMVSDFDELDPAPRVPFVIRGLRCDTCLSEPISKR